MFKKIFWWGIFREGEDNVFVFMNDWGYSHAIYASEEDAVKICNVMNSHGHDRYEVRPFSFYHKNVKEV